MNKQKDWIAQMQESIIRETLDLEQVQLSRKQKESELITDYQHRSHALIKFKQFQQESEEQICKVQEFTEYFEHLREQFQSLSLHTSELQTFANNIKYQMDSQINQASQMQEQYNVLGSNYEQEFLKLMPLLEQQKEQINSIRKQDIQELKAFARPPQLLLKYVQLLMKTLYNVKNLEFRNLLQYLQNPHKLIREWLDFKNFEITEKQISQIRAEFDPEDEPRVRNQSQFGYCIFNWFKIIDLFYNQFQPLQPSKAQLHLLNQNIQQIKNQIQEKQLEFTKIDNQLQQLNQQLTELNNLINQNQSQYDVQVVQRSAFQVLRKIIENFETRVRQLEDEIENVDILAFVESAYNQQFKKYESKECESKIGELAIPFALAKPIEYKLNYCYSNSKSSVVFVFDPYQVGRIIFEIMSQKAQSVCLSTSTEQQIVESSQIIHFINNQQELSQVIQRVNTKEKRQLFFIFERYLLEQLKQVSMDNYVNLDLNEQDLAYIYSNYSINQQYTIGLQRHNDKLKDQVNVLLNILNNNAFETNYQLFSDFKVNYKADWLSLQQFDEQFPLFCSKLFFLLQGKTKLQFTEMANSILNVYQTKSTTPMIYCFKYAFDYSIQYMALNQTLVHPFDDGSEQTLLGLLIHKASLNKEFELSEEEQQLLQKCYVFCSQFLNLTECNVFELISEYIKLKNIYYEQISEVVLQLEPVDAIFECILKQRERSQVLSNLIDNNKNLVSTISKEQQEIEELKANIDFLELKILDNSDFIYQNQNQLNDLNKKLTNQDRRLIYQDIQYLTHIADPDQLTFELFGLLMILIDKDLSWASIQYNTNSKVKINIFNNYEIKKISKNFLDNFNIYTKDEQKLLQIKKQNTQTQKLYKFLKTIRQKYDFYQEKIQLEDELRNCRVILKQDNLELQKQKESLNQLEKKLKQNQSVFQQNQQLIQLEMNVQESLNKNLWFEDQIRQIHQNKQSTLKFMNEQQVISCMYQSCEKQFKQSFLRIQMNEEQQIEQNLVEFQLLNSDRYIDFLQNMLFAIQFQANLNLKQLDLGQQYYQNSQILKCKIIQMIDLMEIDNINQDYLNLFTKELQQNLIKVNKNIKINLKKLECFSLPLFEFSAGLAIILMQSENVEYQSALEFISKFIQQFYVNQTFSRNEFLKMMISQASTFVKGDNLRRLYIQIFILFIYVYQQGHISKLEMAQTLIQDYCKLSNLVVITPQDSLPKIILYLDQYLENNFGEDRFRFCDL